MNEIDNKRVQCHGCKSDDVFENCRSCRIKKCAREKGLSTCIECFQYPCEHIARLESLDVSHHRVGKKYLERIREVGLDQWNSEQEVRWNCPTCGQRFSWFEDICEICGTELKSIEKEWQANNKG